MRLLFLTDSLSERTPNVESLLGLVCSLNASGAECAIVSFLPCKKKRQKQIQTLGIPVRYMQFFNSHINFYAPGLTGSVLYFRPEFVVLASPAAHVHAGPLTRAFRGLPLVSLLPEKRTGLFCRLARKRCALSFDETFPQENAGDDERRLYLENFVNQLTTTYKRLSEK